MALIKCPECKKRISDQCGKCPHCGYPIDEITSRQNKTSEKKTEAIEEKVVRAKKTINKKMLVGISIGFAIILLIGGIITYNALLPQINAKKAFNKAVSRVEELNKKLEQAIKKSEKLIIDNPSLLDDTLIASLENAISDAKVAKVTDFNVPNSVEKIELRTGDLNAVDYTEIMNNLEEGYNAILISAQRYQLVNQPSEAYVIQCLRTIPEIINISAVTEENDPNGQLNKPGGYTATVYFADSRINLDKSIYGETLIEQGTDAGGAIEVYTCVEDAIKRRDYLAVYDGGIFANGTHTVIGPVLVRTSNELTATQQKELELKIINALTYLPEQDKIDFVQDDLDNSKEPSTTVPDTESATTDSNITSTDNTQHTQPSNNHKEQAINIAINNINDDNTLTPNDIRKILKDKGFSESEINHAIYGGYIDWKAYISAFVYGLSQAEVTTITSCNNCNRRFFGEYRQCPDLACSSRVSYSYYYGYSRAETISKAVEAGYPQNDVDVAIQNYGYGEFVDEQDFSDCIVVSGTMCNHFWNPATCQQLSECPYCGETKGEYADHEYSQHVCIYCGAEEAWTPPRISCSSWVSLKELEEKAGYYVETPGYTIVLSDLNDNRVNFVLTGFVLDGYHGNTFELDCNGIIVNCRVDSDSDYVYQTIKLKYSDLVAAGILQ